MPLRLAVLFGGRMTKEQAKKLAQQIFDEFGNQIREAVRGTNIPPEFIAGLVANEAGKDRQGNIRRAATRFEPHIYRKLKQVALNPSLKFQSIRHSDLKDATDEALRALAHSYEATQMMGYWCIPLGCTLADLKNPDKHFFYTVKLLQLNDQNDFSKASEDIFDDEMRQWNTGREKGKTYHANYVPNARLIRAAYRELEKNHKKRPVNERVNIEVSAATPSTSLTDTQGESNPAGTRNPAQPATDGPADGSPLNNSPMVGEQNAEQIINNEAEKQPPPTGKETVIKERPSLFTRVVTAVGGFFTMILASIAATCGGNEVANVVAKQGAERIVENTSRSDLYTLALVVVYIALILASATLMLWIISKFYGRSADRANSLNHAKVETASDPAKNTVELKL
jgi:hypothetical protein